jgi:CheY-like chemotaxis protein
MEEASMRLSGTKVLVVDDAPDNRLLVSRFLALAGAEVDVAASGSEGITLALSGQHHVILMDIQMPGMDGYEVVRRLRSLKYSTPIIALTAHAMLSEKTKCLQSGFNQYLTKPISRSLLIEMVSQMVQLSSQEVLSDAIPIGDNLQGQAQPHGMQEVNQNQSHTENLRQDQK